MSKQVLILNITRMGDLVQMGALLARLQEEWPGAAVDLVVDRQFAPVASMLRGLREVITCDFHQLIDESRACAKDLVVLYEGVSSWARPLVDRGYDRIVNLTFNQPSALLASYVGAPDIRGARSAWDGGNVIDNPWMSYFTDMHHFRRINRFNLVDVYAMGGSTTGAFAPLEITVTEEARAWARRFLSSGQQPAMDWIAVQAGASDVMKAWRPHQFGLTLARLSARWSGGIVLIGTPGEQQTITNVMQVFREAGGGGPLKNAAGQTTLPQLVGLLSECRLLLTNDTGPMHLAVAAKTPVVDLSVGHVDFQETGPYGPGHWVLQPELECAPCGFEQVCAHHACKDRLQPESVAEVILHALGLHDRPAAVSGFRLYQSGIDEDRLGTFRLMAGYEDPLTVWYAAFWRRHWYQTCSGACSHVSHPPGPPPDAASVSELMRGVLPLLERMCRRAEQIVGLVERRPIAVQRLQTLQRAQIEDRERVASLGMSTLATAPLTAACLRRLHNDNLHGLERLSRYHSTVYRAWRTEFLGIHRSLFGTEITGSSRHLGMLPDAVPVTAGKKRSASCMSF